MTVQQLSLEDFTEQVSSQHTDVIGAKLGGSILGFSDEWFAEASNLIQPKPPIRDATKFVYSGAWYDGWETRRHNSEEYDWVIIKFGVSSAKLIGAEIDTAFFNGNHAPAISIEALNSDTDDVLNDKKWDVVFDKVECGPSQRHFFKIAELSKVYTHAKLKMYPDGGIARFRLYGDVVPNFQTLSVDSVIDYAAVQNGGVAVSFSDQHFGTADNLLLPGRGHDMSDGWETKRSRTAGHVDWVIIKLGTTVNIKEVVVDTAHFRGNFPNRISLKAINTDELKPSYDTDKWVSLLGEEKTYADKEHVFKDLLNNDAAYTHVALTIIPDGGVKRVRVLGTKS
ncbi:hypothetical protein WICPIJ_007424 [Wickerhamomyces pijperi]|uniref:allantoicase n=1 Tax=Wickerhamomyces pijperi TaxID=599730 RepID=A0A9P8Q092_WICPI|nr:hypothetical protein WICPIJ_007424 [Wickerhamomyces pijperi]